MKLPGLLRNYDRPNNQPTDHPNRPSDRPGHKEVSLPMIMKNIVNKKWTRYSDQPLFAKQQGYLIVIVCKEGGSCHF